MWPYSYNTTYDAPLKVHLLAIIIVINITDGKTSKQSGWVEEFKYLF